MKQANPVLILNPMNKNVEEPKINENTSKSAEEQSKPAEEDTIILCCMCYCLYTMCLSCLLSN